MPDYVLGDKVRLVNIGSAHWSWEGRTGTVEKISSSGVWVRDDEDQTIRLPWAFASVEHVQAEYALAVAVLGEDYFA